MKYTFYDDQDRKIAIVNQNIPKEEIQNLLKEYNEVKFKE